MKRAAPGGQKTKPQLKRRKTSGLPAPVNPWMTRTIDANDIHFIDTADATDATTTVVAVPVNTVAAGDTIITRDGNKILMRGLEMKMVASLEDATGPQQVRVVVVYDMQPNNATAALSTVLVATTMLGFPEVMQKSRFKILYDKVFTVNPTTTTSLAKFYRKKYLKLANLPAVYGSGGASVPNSGGLTVYYVGDTAAGAADLNFSINCRLTFFG